MRQIYTLLAAALVIGSTGCSSSRNAQNTDDIYYSNGGSKTAAATNSVSSGGAGQGDYYSTTPSDNYVRMAMTDPRFSTFADYNSYDSYYYSPAISAGYGYGYPAYGFGYPSYGMGMGFGFGLGFGYGVGMWDPYMAWNSYYMWNSWYNPYFYNPYYGVPVMVIGHTGPAAMYSNLRPFNSLAYRNGLNTKMGTASGNNRFYRPGMSGTSAYNSRVSGSGSSNGTYYRPVNNNSNGGFRPANSFSSPTRSYSPSSFGGGGGGGFRPGRH